MPVHYTDEGSEYPELAQPSGEYVRKAEDEFDGQDVTWPQINARAWELQRADQEPKIDE